MIISRSPLRISLAGGGTDFPEFYQNSGANWISAAINKHCYCQINSRFSENHLIKYSKLEIVETLSKIEHKLIRETLKKFEITNYIELTFSADLPGGTGLGSSASFLTSLIASLCVYSGKKVDAYDLAQLAFHIEHSELQEPVGVQDHYISAVGGLTKFHANENGVITWQELPVSPQNLIKLQKSLLLVYTGITRNSNSMLDKFREMGDPKNYVKEHLDFVASNFTTTMHAIQNADINSLGKIFHEHWLMKKKSNRKMSNQSIEELYDAGLELGAFGGKLVGAGGGGFLLFVCKNREKLIEFYSSKGVVCVEVEFDFHGTKILYTG
jgi:D-glycero-alpha-D-manno-heptose-7-phosphate kinase